MKKGWNGTGVLEAVLPAPMIRFEKLPDSKGIPGSPRGGVATRRPRGDRSARPRARMLRLVAPLQESS